MNLLTSFAYLVALSEHRHFARAAEACHITQPALSNALRALEREFGTPIVRRGRVYAGLTEEGERILLTARRMLHEHQLLKQELHAGTTMPTGTLRFGVVPTAVAVAAKFSSALQAAYPGIAVVLRSLSSHEIETGLVDLTLDLGLGFSERVSSKTGRIESVMQYEDRHFLLQRLPGGSGFEIGPSCSWEDAAQLRLCLLAPEMHNRQIIERAFRQAGVQVTPVIETNSVLALMLCVAAGEAAGVVPGSLVASTPAGAGFTARPLIQPEVATPVGLLVLTESARSRTLQIAVDFAQSASWQGELGSGAIGWSRFNT